MTDLKPGVPDYIPQCSEALRKRGAPQDTIDRFAELWRSLRPHARNLPCPFCFASGYSGKLIAMREKGGIKSVRCKICKKEIVVQQAF